MQLIEDRERCTEVPSAHGEPGIRIVYAAADAPYEMVYLEQPAHDRQLITIERKGQHKGVFKIAFQTESAVAASLLKADVLMQLRKLRADATGDDVFDVLYALGVVYGKDMSKLRSMVEPLVFLRINKSMTTARFTSHPRVLPVVARINARGLGGPS